jgi:transposase
MGTNYRPYEPDQPFLFPPSLRDWLPENHLAYFISDTLDQLDLSALHQPYQGDGRRNQPYHPTMLVKVLVYAYATGVFSSRKIAGKLVDDVALRLLAAGNQPDFRTINRFRQQHLETFGELFVEIVRLAQKMGLVKLGTVALDGTKVKANASKHKAMSYQRMKEEEQRLEKEIQQLIEKAQQTDAAEDELYGPDKSGDELPPELQRREQRLEKIREAKQALEEEQAEKDKQQGRHPGDGKVASETRPQGGCSKFKREFGEPKPQAQRNFSDPESRIMKSKQSFEQCYNAQAAVDAEHQLVVATDLMFGERERPG